MVSNANTVQALLTFSFHITYNIVIVTLVPEVLCYSFWTVYSSFVAILLSFASKIMLNKTLTGSNLKGNFYFINWNISYKQYKYFSYHKHETSVGVMYSTTVWNCLSDVAIILPYDFSGATKLLF